jgi:hypothetical protein
MIALYSAKNSRDASGSLILRIYLYGRARDTRRRSRNGRDGLKLGAFRIEPNPPDECFVAVPVGIGLFENSEIDTIRNPRMEVNGFVL